MSGVLEEPSRTISGCSTGGAPTSCAGPRATDDGTGPARLEINHNDFIRQDAAIGDVTIQDLGPGAVEVVAFVPDAVFGPVGLPYQTVGILVPIGI